MTDRDSKSWDANCLRLRERGAGESCEWMEGGCGRDCAVWRGISLRGGGWRREKGPVVFSWCWVARFLRENPRSDQPVPYRSLTEAIDYIRFKESMNIGENRLRSIM